MSFTPTPNGTRGAAQPGALTRRVNALAMRRIVRRGGGRVMGMEALVLTTVGRRSGRTRKTPVARFEEKGGTWLIVASANGAARNPDWYYNLAAHPDRVAVTLDGRTMEVTAEQLRGEEREKVWRVITAVQPRFAGYTEKTDRELPVIRLTPRPVRLGEGPGA
ncbi:nitroreductase/quinone reductase family protein [Streptomyces sp. NPDC056600]|uniref:nitroreductase/quinone reductase family protein n=1 Tax=Streptomyces sp. NPDC056600 TaxID=3345874 RepID=UPI0036CA6854